MATAARESGQTRSRTSIIEWLTTVDHKKIGLMYVVTSFVMFILSGILALLIRTELAAPGTDILTPDQYTQAFTMHGTGMIFLFVIPMLVGFGNYLVPLQIGARDMAYPQLNALSFWLYLAGALLMTFSFLLPQGASSAGWTAYPPLSTSASLSPDGMDVWVIGLQITGASSLMGAINFIVTIFNMRAPGMTLWKLPLFTWTVQVMSFMVLIATPMLSGALILLLADRNLGTQFFSVVSGGDPVLWQHLFWFYSHPAVYIMVLPAMGAVSEILPVFSRKPIYGYSALVWSTIAIGGMGFATWAHHMFTTGLTPVTQAFFVLSTMAIAVPTGIKMFNWIYTMIGGSIRFALPMWYAIGFLAMFLIGGITGVFLAILPLDTQFHDTYFVVGHLHYVLFGGTVFGIFGAFYFWWPKFFGYLLNGAIGRIQWVLLFIGFNLTFFPQFILGIMGMPRRIYDYEANPGWVDLNLLSTIGSFLIALAALLFMVNIVYSWLNKQEAGDDPWEADTLEWLTTSPPQDYNFETIPTVYSRRPVRDMRLGFVSEDFKLVGEHSSDEH